MSETIESTLVIVDPARPPAPPPSPVSTTALPQRLSDLDRMLAGLSAEKKFPEALALLERMRQAAPNEARIQTRIARVAGLAGDWGRAETAAKAAIAAGAGDLGCYIALARTARLRNDFRAALAALDSAAALPGTYADLLVERAEVCRLMGDKRGAAAALEAALNITPDAMTLCFGLVQMLVDLGERDQATRLCRRLIRIAAPDSPAQIALGNLLQSAGMEAEAIAAYDRAITLNPQAGGALSNKGAVLRRMGRFDEALAAYDRAAEVAPKESGTFYNRGNLLKSLGQYDAAVASYDRAIALDPANGTTHWNKALALLSKGDLKAGFIEYEWRWRHSGFPTRPRSFPQPVWTGGPLNGQTLLVYSEQGQGDMIQFLRFVPALRTLGGRVLLEVHEELFDLVAGQSLADGVIRRGSPLPAFDVQVPIGSLAHRLGVTLNNLPASPYLVPLPGSAAPLPPRDGKPRIGLVWAGNPQFSGDKDRSMQFAQAAPLLSVPGIDWYSLQKGYAEAQIPADAPITPLGPLLTDWQTTARSLSELDLIISTCTSVPHLAGAMGRPVWVMLGWDADWRWLGREHATSPWYPSARLFRQPVAGDWASVTDAVSAALRGIAFEK